MEWIYDTGGREKYYKAVHVGDCATRAFAIAAEMDYKEAYMMVKEYNDGETPRNGVFGYIIVEMMEDLGWEYVKYNDPDAYLADAEIPTDKVIIGWLGNHFAAVINGVLHDTWNSSKSKRTKGFKGYWVRPDKKSV